MSRDTSPGCHPPSSVLDDREQNYHQYNPSICLCHARILFIYNYYLFITKFVQQNTQKFDYMHNLRVARHWYHLQGAAKNDLPNTSNAITW